MDRREFMKYAGACGVGLAVSGGMSLADAFDLVEGKPAFARIQRADGTWSYVHRRPKGEIIAVVRNYGAEPVA